jgi:hypothetical protein
MWTICIHIVYSFLNLFYVSVSQSVVRGQAVVHGGSLGGPRLSTFGYLRNIIDKILSDT